MPSDSNSSDSNTAHAFHGKVAAAVKEMQAEVFGDTPLQLYRKLGQGGFGTVYHGSTPPR